VPYEWVVSLTHETCYKYITHVTCILLIALTLLMSHKHYSLHIYITHVTYILLIALTLLMSHIYYSCNIYITHVTHISRMLMKMGIIAIRIVTYACICNMCTSLIYILLMSHTYYSCHIYITHVDAFALTWVIYTWREQYIFDMSNIYLTWVIYMWHEEYIFDMSNAYAQDCHTNRSYIHASCHIKYKNITWRLGRTCHIWIT